MFHIVGAIAEFERDVIRERTTAGLNAARARGRKGGRDHQAAQPGSCERTLRRPEKSIAEIMEQTGFKSRATFYKCVVNVSKEV